MIFIGDVAGQYDALMRLVEKCPQDQDILLLGDLCDRGPQSKEVIEWVIQNPRVDSVMANHEHMFLDWYNGTEQYDHNLWVEYNGGEATLRSYCANPFSIYDREGILPYIPKSHVDFLKSRPMFKEGPDWIATHAPITDMMPFEDALVPYKTGKKYATAFERSYICDHSVLWNRGEPEKRDKFQINGHNSHWGLCWYTDTENKEPWGVCLDASRHKVLTAMIWPDRTIIQVPYEN